MLGHERTASLMRPLARYGEDSFSCCHCTEIATRRLPRLDYVLGDGLKYHPNARAQGS